jgi:hypothetical protein
MSTTLRDGVNNLDAAAKNVIEEYITRSSRLDTVLVRLTRAYCADCPRNASYGCCDFAQEAIREMPPEAVALQEAECLENGGTLKEMDGICRYHAPEGCTLKVMKSSSCLGHLCNDLKDHLIENYAEDAMPFIDAMAKLVVSSLDREPAALLRAMDSAISLGERL